MEDYSLDYLNCLINGLIFKNIIQSKSVESALRCVNRDYYNISKNGPNANLDAQIDKIHSIPIYAEVLEYLSLRPGDKFLNIGSGVGYLNTVAGLLLGSHGINHGIEIRQSDVELAYQKLTQFKLKAAAIDYFDFCEPIFVHGNVFEVSPTASYNKIFCEGSISPTHDMFMRSFLQVGGVLVVPIQHTFYKITRTAIDEWETVELSWILVSKLIEADNLNAMPPAKFPVQPKNLVELCRSTIRLTLRNNLLDEFPHLTMRTKCTNQYSEEFVIQHLNGAYSARAVNINLNSLEESEFDEVSGIPETDNEVINDLVDRELKWLRFPKVLSVFFRIPDRGHYQPEVRRPMNAIFPVNDDDRNDIINVIKSSSSAYNVILERTTNDFSKHLRDKINEIPLPRLILCYLNYEVVD